MIKKKAALAAGIILLSLMTSCREKAPDYSNLEMNIDDLAEKISTAVKYDDFLYPLDDFVTEAMYTGISAVDCVSYGGTGATSEAVAIFEASGPAEAEAFTEKLENYRKECAAAFEKYTAGEIDKLNTAIIRSVGKYAIFSVSPDSEAVNAVIDEFIKENM